MMNNQEIKTRTVDLTELVQGEVFKARGSWYTIISEDADKYGFITCVELNTGEMWDLPNTQRVEVLLNTVRFF